MVGPRNVLGAFLGDGRYVDRQQSVTPVGQHSSEHANGSADLKSPAVAFSRQCRQGSEVLLSFVKASFKVPRIQVSLVDLSEVGRTQALGSDRIHHRKFNFQLAGESVGAYGCQGGVETGLSKVEPQITDDTFRWFRR